MEKLNPLVIFLDFKKAFDTISHKKLTDKLEKMGMDNVTLAWFNSYLSQRLECVKVNNNVSDLLPSSILGPILFGIYINEIVNTVNCGIVLYVDDTVIYHYTKPLSTIQCNKTLCQDQLDPYYS